MLLRLLALLVGHVRRLTARRSGKWPPVERQAFERDGHRCQACGASNRPDLRGHHIIPFHERRDLELVLENAITLCQPKGGGCHLRVGHRGNYRDINPNVVEDCQRLRKGK